jgi:hypothetical protein
MLYTRTLGVLLSFLCFSLFFFSSASAQITYFDQNAASPGINFFSNNVYLFATGNQDLVKYENTTEYLTFIRVIPKGGNANTKPQDDVDIVGFVHSGNFSTPPPTELPIIFEMQVLVSANSGANPGSQATYFYIGSGLREAAQFITSSSQLFGKFGLSVQGNNNFKARAEGTTFDINLENKAVWYKCEIVLNDRTTDYVYQRLNSPNNDQTWYTLPPNHYHVWILDERLRLSSNGTPNLLRISNSSTLSNVGFRIERGDAEVRFRNARILPVNLISFNAQPMGEKVELAWQTAWEKNSKEFVVQRSSDLKEFGDLATLPAAGDAQSRNSYTFTDHSPLPGTNYYRLRMVDFDGTYEYSKVIDAQLRPDQPLVLVSPNPATAQLIRLRAFNTDASSLRLTNLLGQEVPFRTHSSGGEVLELLPLQPLTPGLYLLTLQQGGLRQHTKVLVR